MTPDVEDHYLVEQIRQALAMDDRVNELGLIVAVAEGTAVIKGTVSTAQRREAVTSVVSELAPGYEVVNQTTVTSDAETEQVEDLS